MAWTPEQQQRLGVERALLRRMFPTMQWYDPTGRTFVQGDLTTNAGNRFTVRVVIPADMPHSLPTAII
ncbi:MAG: hypothetical protein AMXMBFR64_12570 [Myxococcales bacterium]